MSSATSLSNSSSFISVSSRSAPPSNKSFEQLPLRFDKLIDFFFDCTAAHELVHQDILSLADAEGAVGGLVFHRRVPPAVKV